MLFMLVVVLFLCMVLPFLSPGQYLIIAYSFGLDLEPSYLEKWEVLLEFIQPIAFWELAH